MVDGKNTMSIIAIIIFCVSCIALIFIFRLRTSVLRSICLGMVSSIIATYPIVIILAFTIGYPAPFNKHLVIMDSLSVVLFDIMFIGMFGGYIYWGVIGGIAGYISYRIIKDEKNRATVWPVVFGIIATLISNLSCTITR
jgi:hypothetical protein